MRATGEGFLGRWQPRLASHLAEPQHRNAYFLMMTNATTAAAGFFFWYLLAGLAKLPAAEIGVGFAIVALGTTVGVLAKGGFDTALLRNVPHAGRDEGMRLLRFGIALAATIALALTVVFAGASLLGALPQLGIVGWILVAAIGILLAVTWLQDAHFLAEGDARYSFQRNLVLSAARLILPLPIVFLTWPHPVALTWALAIFVSALAATAFARALPARAGQVVPRRGFVRGAMRNVTGSAAEFLPGLFLAPLVLAMSGADAAGYFGIAWTAASLLFVMSAAIGRSALAEMVRRDSPGRAPAIRKAALHNALIVLPAALVAIALAPQVLSVFGSAYAREATFSFILLCASAIFVAPAYLYLAVLRADDRTHVLVLFPALMIAALLVAAPLLETRYGFAGVAIAWMVANAPFGIFGAWKLRQHAREVTSHRSPSPVVRGSHLE